MRRLPARWLGALLVNIALVGVLLTWWLTAHQADPGFRWTRIEAGWQVVEVHRESLSGLLGQTITGIERSDGVRLEFAPEWGAPAIEFAPTQTLQARFLEGERQLLALVGGNHTLLTQEGERFPLQFEPRSPGQLPGMFWIITLSGLLAYSFGSALLLYVRRESGVWLYWVGGLGYFIGMLVRAWVSNRAWALPPEHILFGMHLSHLAALIFVAAMFVMIWKLPRPLGWRAIPALVVVAFIVTYALDTARVVESTRWTYQYPILLTGLLLVSVAIWQWTRARHDVVDRLAMRWLVLTLGLGLVPPACLYAVWAMGLVGNYLNAISLVSVVTFFAGLAALIVRYQLFRLEVWWWRIWLWLLSGMLILIFDLLLVANTALGANLSLLLSVVAVGWGYFPVRQWLLSRLGPSRPRALEKYVPDLIALAAHGSDLQKIDQSWRALLERVFEPARMKSGDSPRPLAIEALVRSLERAPVLIEDGGRGLQVPGVLNERISLIGASRNLRPFTPEDQRFAAALAGLLWQTLKIHISYLQGVEEERRRIAADLHDDIGGKLLYMSRAGADARLQRYARNTLEDLRFLTRGLSAAPRRWSEVLADIRWQVGQSADAAGTEFTWRCSLPPELLEQPCPSTVAANWTCLFSELARNALEHAAPRSIEVDIQQETGGVTLCVCNDGDITPPESWSNGLGVASIRRRVDSLRGSCSWRQDNDRIFFSARLPIPEFS